MKRIDKSKKIYYNNPPTGVDFMVLYNENGKEIIIDDNYEKNGIGKGEFGKVYRVNMDQCVKVYGEDLDCYYRLKEKVYNILKQIQSDFLVQIDQLLYSNQLDKVAGYLMKYYSPQELKILEKDTDYSLYILEKFMKLSELLTRKHITMDDLKRDNIIYTGKEIVIIDPDFFEYHPNFSIEHCQTYNYREIDMLIRRIYYSEIRNIDTTETSVNPYKKVAHLFDYDCDHNMVKSLSHKLKKYKYPIDYFLE